MDVTVHVYRQYATLLSGVDLVEYIADYIKFNNHSSPQCLSVKFTVMSKVLAIIVTVAKEIKFNLYSKQEECMFNINISGHSKFEKQ